MKEIEEVTYTSFPNFDECDNNEFLEQYLRKKTIRTVDVASFNRLFHIKYDCFIFTKQ